MSEQGDSPQPASQPVGLPARQPASQPAGPPAAPATPPSTPAPHTHLRGLLRIPSCWSRASGATTEGCSGADISMEARTAASRWQVGSQQGRAADGAQKAVDDERRLGDE